MLKLWHYPVSGHYEEFSYDLEDKIKEMVGGERGGEASLQLTRDVLLTLASLLFAVICQLQASLFCTIAKFILKTRTG